MIWESEAGREAEGGVRMSKSDGRSHGQAEGITRTCAVLRVRGKGSEAKRNEREAKRRDPGEREAEQTERGRQSGARHLDNPIFPVTIA